MPSNLKRYYGSDDLHFITASCHQRRSLLDASERRDLFLNVLERTRRRYRFVVLGYVVMPEHVHLLLSEPRRDSLSAVMQALKLGFVRRLLTPGCALRQASLGHGPDRIWQARFYDFNVWTERKRIEKLRYMHRNPVKRGLVSSPEQWALEQFPFLSYRGCRAGTRQRHGDSGDESSAARRRPPMSRKSGETWGTPRAPHVTDV